MVAGEALCDAGGDCLPTAQSHIPLRLAFDELRGMPPAAPCCAPSALAVGGIGLVSAGCCIVVEKKAPARVRGE